MPFSISGLLSRETDIGRRALARRWKKACINLFITYFNPELKRTKLTSHRYQSYGYVLVTTVVEPVFTCCHGFFIFSTKESVSPSETATNLSSRDDDISQTTIDSWAEVTSCVARTAWYRVFRVLPRYLHMSWYCCDTYDV